MIIAIICDVLGKANNGTTIAAKHLINALREKGHTVRVVCPDEEHRGEPGWYIVPPYNFGPFQKYVKENGVAPARLDRAVLEEAIADADAIHVMLPFALGKAAAQYAAAHGIPLTAGFHCQAENITGHILLKDRRGVNRLVYRILYRRLYRYCDCIHYPTQFICDTFEAVVGPTPHRIISNGVSREFTPGPSRQHTANGGFTVLFIGRYSPEKSHDVLIDAVSRSRHKEEIQLVFAGAGPRRQKLLRRARRRGIPTPVMRFFDRKELIDVIRSADLYVHPAEIEIEAISCLEAIACGKVPLIADSPRSATRYFALSEQNLFRVNDPADLAAKMDWWLEHPEEREACSAQYRNYALRFDFDRCMNEMEQMMVETACRRHEE
ncbi:MAG: glycosyltransferase [Oscillospiraceae bacterium]